MKRILIVGYGDVARRCVPWLQQRFRLAALVRQPGQEKTEGVRALLADLDDRGSLRRLGGIADGVLYFAPPAAHGSGDRRLQYFLAALGRAGSLPQRIIYISTSGVYGDCGGALVNETRPCRARTARARRRVAAEALLRDFGVRNTVAVSILRAPGIYAADRLPVARLQRGDPVLSREDDVYTNHIHADDLARLAVLALFRGRPGRVYNASDDSELRMGDYFDLVADRLGLPRPPRLGREEIAARLSAVSLSFMQESRRLDNRRLKAELRARLLYPTVADALRALGNKQDAAAKPAASARVAAENNLSWSLSF